MTQPVGIVGSQSVSRTNATTSRNTSKGRLKKIRLYVIVLVVILSLLNWWRNIPDKESFFSSASSQSSTSNKQSFSAKWARADDGTIPVGVWSETVTIQPGCGIRYDSGFDTVYKVQYLYYSKEWKPHTGGLPNANEVQFAVLQKGIDEVRYRIVCY